MNRWWLVCVAMIMVSCGGHPLTAPSPLGVDVTVRDVWSPYLGVHTFGPYTVQKPYLEELNVAGALRGVRLELGSPDEEMFARQVFADGITDIVALFPNKYLRGAGSWDALAGLLQRNPNIIYWEIGNEVSGFIQMTPQEYFPIFRDLYLRAKREFPQAVLIPQAIIGGGEGDQFLGDLLDAGLQDLAHHTDPAMRLRVVAVHHYNDRSLFTYNLKAQLDRLPPDIERWVTETGVNNWNAQKDYVRVQYPRIQNFYGATRVYWYVLHECSEYSLVSGLSMHCFGPPRYSPLYTALTGQEGGV